MIAPNILFMDRKREHKRYQGLYRDPDAPNFSRFVPQTVVRFTIEKTEYRARPHKVIFWGEHKGEAVQMLHMLMTDDDLHMLYQTIKNRLGE